jgi:rubrerythrin
MEEYVMSRKDIENALIDTINIYEEFSKEIVSEEIIKIFFKFVEENKLKRLKNGI